MAIMMQVGASQIERTLLFVFLLMLASIHLLDRICDFINWSRGIAATR